MNTYVKYGLIAVAVGGGVYLIAKSRGPSEPKTPVSQVIDSLGGLVGKISNFATGKQTTATPELAARGLPPGVDKLGDSPWSVSASEGIYAAIADGMGLRRSSGRQVAPSGYLSKADMNFAGLNTPRSLARLR